MYRFNSILNVFLKEPIYKLSSKKYYHLSISKVLIMVLNKMLYFKVKLNGFISKKIEFFKRHPTKLN